MAVDKFLTEDGLNYFYNNKVLPYLNSNMIIGADSRAMEYTLNEERTIGHWVNGKPIYQKTVHIPQTNPASGYMEYNPTEPIEDMLDAELYVQDNDNSKRYVVRLGGYSKQSMSGNANYNVGLCLYFNDQSSGSPNVFRIIGAGNYIFNTVNDQWLTYRYTKTTDPVDSYHYQDPYYISRPDLWPANQEIDFGDGLYGYRAYNPNSTPDDGNQSGYMGNGITTICKVNSTNLTLVDWGGGFQEKGPNKESTPINSANDWTQSLAYMNQYSRTNICHLKTRINGSQTWVQLLHLLAFSGGGTYPGSQILNAWVTYRKD